MSPQPSIRRGRASDLPAVLALLDSARLPTVDIASIDEPQIWVFEEQNEIIAVIGLERFGSEALLRSLAVLPEYRRRGFGRELVGAVEQSALRDGVCQLVLLTETAEAFFRSLGYLPTDRGTMSDRLKQSAEFRSLCPASASCLSKVLANPS